MKKLLIAAVLSGLLAGGAFAQAPPGNAIRGVVPGTPDFLLSAPDVNGRITVSSTVPLPVDLTGAGGPIVTGYNTKTVLLGAHTYTLAAAGSSGFGAGWGACLLASSGTALVNATSSIFVGASGSTSLTLQQGDWACIGSDATNYTTIAAHYVSGAGTMSSLFPGAGLSSTAIAGGTAPITSTGTLYVDASYFTAFLSGMILSNDATTPTSVIDISSGGATDDTNNYSMKLGTFTKSLAGGTFTAGSGNRCLAPTETLTANTWYYVFVIANTTNSLVDILCSHSITAPVLPVGYSIKRWIGEIATDGSSNIRAFTTLDGHLYRWKVATYQTSSVGTSQTLVTLDLPPGINIEPRCRVSMSNASLASVLITDPYVTDAAPSTATPFTSAPGWDQIDVTLTNGVFNSNCPSGILTNLSGQVAAHASAASTTVNFITKGWSQ